VAGKKYNIEIVVEDDQSSPPGAISAANKLLQQGIKFIMAPIFPPNNHAIAQICEEAKVIRMAASQLDPTQFPAEQRYNFDANMTYYHVIPVYDYLKRAYPNVKKVALLSPDDPGPVVSRKHTIEVAKKLGMEVVIDEVFQTNTEDFYPILTKVLAKKPDAIDGVGGIPPWAAGIINQSREMGFTGPIFAPAIFGDPYLIEMMAKPEYYTDVFEGGPDVRSDKMLPEVKELRTIVEKAGQPFIFDSVNDMVVIYLLLQGIEAAQSLDTDKVVEAFEKMTSVKHIWGGTAQWSGKDLGGSNHMIKLDNVPLVRIMNGKFEFEWLKR
ncbi:MAG: ABC transporter substrate-binding protein, partial [Deltaproteobacteria bacterium]|nr:ABC transporter substrate-binding protein [Deltaproteobacteria bacterium]